MKLTTKSEYSLLALIYIARHGNSQYVKVADICDEYDIPKKYLEQLMTNLKMAGYISTRRGSGGGYKLKSSPTEISVAEVIRTMDGKLAPVESVSRYFFSHTPLETEQKIYDVLKEIRDYVSDKLENLKISDLV